MRRRWISTIAYMSDELPAHVGDRPRTFIVNTDTCDRGGSHWVAFQFPLVGPAEFFDLAGKRTGNLSPPFRQCPDVQRTAILLLFVSNPTRRHRHLRTVLPVLLQTETSRNGPADIVKEFSTVYLKGNEDTILRSNLTLYIVMHCNCRYDRMY